jgi:transposase
VANNTLKEELSELNNEELISIVETHRADLSSIKDKYQKTTLASYELQLKLDEIRLKLDNSEDKLKKAYEEIAELRYQLNYYLNDKYGTSSDSLPDEQDSTFDEPDIEEDISSEQQDNKQVTVKSHTRNVSSKPRALPEDLPREQLTIDIPDDDKVCNCGCELQRIGEDKSEKLDIIPTKLRIIEIIRPKYACRACEEGVHQSPMPKTAIPKGIPTPGTLAHVILSKYEDHLPLYRQESMLKRMGVEIPRNTLCDWVMKCSKLLTPLYELIKDDLLEAKYMQVDETPVKVLKQKSKHYMWCYLSKAPDKPIVIYDYCQSRGGYNAQEFLKGFNAILHTDGYYGYNKVDCLIHCACWTHARRKFIDIVKNTKKSGIARTVVNYIDELYAIEKKARTMSHSDRQLLRQKHAPEILDKLKKYLDEKQHKVPPKSTIGKAIAYTLNLWDRLIIYVDHGEIEMDTNLVENVIRPFALGRRNWLFKGSESGGRASSIAYSILLTCKANNIEPYAYLKYILYKIPKINSIDELRQLLPYNIQKDKLSNAYKEIWY